MLCLLSAVMRPLLLGFSNSLFTIKKKKGGERERTKGEREQGEIKVKEEGKEKEGKKIKRKGESKFDIDAAFCVS
jgi:hypothetical protein